MNHHTHMNADVLDYLTKPRTWPLRCRCTELDKALAIVETRPLPHLPHVIASAVDANPGWRLYVFAPPAVHDFLAPYVTGYARVTLDRDDMTTQDYSALLTTPDFWTVFREEHVLLFQADCVLVRAVPPRCLDFAYIGALCGHLTPRDFVMNGGLSLRRTSAMLRAVGLMDEDLRRQPEDVAFCTVLRRHGFNLPSMRDCDDFAIESQGNPRTAVGMHGTDKGYAPPALIADLLS
jgi:Protein of unknown function (DUF5672)